MDAAYLPSAVIFSSVPATLLITGVATSAREYILVIGAGFWQPVIPQGLSLNQSLISHWSLILSLKKSSLPPYIQAFSTHPAACCQMHLANHSVVPRYLNN